MSNRVDFDDFTGNYNELLREGTHFFSPSEEYFARYKVAIVRRRLGTAVGRLLEYGCGIGRNIPFLRQAFPEATVVGSDISAASLDIARKENAGVDFFREGDEQARDVGAYDVIFVAGVFHHIPVAHRLGVARNLCDRLRPGGQLFVFEHNPLNPVTRHIVSNCPYDEDAVLIGRSKLRRTLVHAGMTVEDSAYCLFVPPRFPAIARREYLIGWLPLGGQYWVQARRPG